MSIEIYNPRRKNMKNLHKILLGCSALVILPAAANAAGTYYTGNYQSPQSRYQNQSYLNRNAVNPTSTMGYNNPNLNRVGTTRTTTTTVARSQNGTKTAAGTNQNKKGFYLDGGLAHEIAQWRFEMKDSGSILHYDNIAWNVLDVRGKYIFGLGDAGRLFQVDAGLKYGMQWGESDMIDDDVTNGGYGATSYCESIDANGNCVGHLGTTVAHAMSIGTSKDGSMMGFYAGFGATDFFKIGGVRMTPSVGLRYLKYKLETKGNYGMSVDTAACFEDSDGEIQCDPAIIIYDANGNKQLLWREKNDLAGWAIEGGSGQQYVDTGGTYYYQQPGTSHSYEVEWFGPYVAMDFDYDINAKNAVNARVELGAPGYTATGDQPYRFDWQHPKSVEDKADMFGALHFGLGANWTTAITNTISLSVGLTFDYYSVSGADSKTYLNGAYYTGIYNAALAVWQEQYPGETAANVEAMMLNTSETAPTADLSSARDVALAVKETERQCSGWVCNMGGEIDSFYKSMGIRVGINARF